MILSGWPGIGKSHFKKNSKFVVHDSDSTQFSKLENGEPNPNFVDEYITHISKLAETEPDSIILVSTHQMVLEKLAQSGLMYYVIIPKPELKDEYIQRYIERGSPQPMIDLISNNWTPWLEHIKANHKYFELESEEFLSDFITKTYEQH